MHDLILENNCTIPQYRFVLLGGDMLVGVTFESLKFESSMVYAHVVK